MPETPFNPDIDYPHLARKQAVRIAELEAENRRLREALEGLLDVQNDAPLGIREEEWKQAVERARAALSQEENPCD